MIPRINFGEDDDSTLFGPPTFSLVRLIRDRTIKLIPLTGSITMEDGGYCLHKRYRIGYDNKSLVKFTIKTSPIKI